MHLLMLTSAFPQQCYMIWSTDRYFWTKTLRDQDISGPQEWCRTRCHGVYCVTVGNVVQFTS